MAELDAVLRDAFARAAEPGDPAGVAAAIRARVDAGDTGTPAATSGFGGSPWRRLWPYIAGVALVVILAVVVVLSGVFSPVPAMTTAPVPAQAETASATPEPTASPTRTPNSTPTATLTPTVEPAPAAPVADTAAPSLGAASASPSGEIYAADAEASPGCPISSVLSVTASDNVGVAGVRVTWSGAESGSADLSFGSVWSFSFNPAQTTPESVVTFTFVARDAAGNTSGPVTTTLNTVAAGGCII